MFIVKKFSPKPSGGFQEKQGPRHPKLPWPSDLESCGCDHLKRLQSESASCRSSSLSVYFASFCSFSSESDPPNIYKGFCSYFRTSGNFSPHPLSSSLPPSLPTTPRRWGEVTSAVAGPRSGGGHPHPPPHPPSSRRKRRAMAALAGSCTGASVHHPQPCRWNPTCHFLSHIAAPSFPSPPSPLLLPLPPPPRGWIPATGACPSTRQWVHQRSGASPALGRT